MTFHHHGLLGNKSRAYDKPPCNFSKSSFSQAAWRCRRELHSLLLVCLFRFPVWNIKKKKKFVRQLGTLERAKEKKTSQAIGIICTSSISLVSFLKKNKNRTVSKKILEFLTLVDTQATKMSSNHNVHHDIEHAMHINNKHQQHLFHCHWKPYGYFYT